jgi:hypothetical protein
MALAKKCDRCMCYYTKSLDGDPPDGIVTAEWNASGSGKRPFSNYEEDNQFDLCPGCYNDFKNKFMAREAFVSDE